MTKFKVVSSLILFAGVVAFVLWSANPSELIAAAKSLSPLWLLAIFAALVLNVLVAALRLKVIVGDISRSISFKQALAVVSSSSLAGAAFFQIVGQLMARGVILGKSGIPLDSVVVITLYERAVAAAVSVLLALAGAYFIFGEVFLDQQAGGGELIKISVGLILAAVCGALVSYGRATAQAIAPIMTHHFAMRFLTIVGLSILVQLPMMAAYVFAAHSLSPNVSIINIVAASTIVMFAASIPISLAGWGVREMSAVIALSTIGVPAAKALIAAIIVGAGSMIAVAIIAAASWAFREVAQKEKDHGSQSNTIDYEMALAWSLPIAAATLVLFQIYVPISSGTLLNVNLADPLAILGGSLFFVKSLQSRRLPKWRIPYINFGLAAATLTLSLSLLLGATRFGWTEWAWINRYLGWFVLLGYAATGAMIVNAAGRRGLITILLTYAAASASIAAMEMTAIALKEAGLLAPFPLSRTQIMGFAQNPNFFAFQLLMALAATLAVATSMGQRLALTSILLAGIWFTGSRSAWIAVPFVLLFGLYVKTVRLREILIAACVALLLVGISWFPAIVQGQPPVAQPELFPTPQNTAERLFSITGGLKLFSQYPAFGAGLGAFRHEMVSTGTTVAGIPLLIHSTGIWLLAETGSIGFLVFFGMALSILVTEIRRKPSDRSSKLIVMCLVAFGVMSLPADMLYQRSMWLLLGAGMACVSPRSETQ